MNREQKLALVQRSLGIRHKLKVHDTMKAPDSHEEVSQILLAKWELEDELRAIEEILESERQDNVEFKRKHLKSEFLDGRVPKKKIKS